jgi:hypothetical protein
MAAASPDDALIIDVRDDVQRVDGVMTRVVTDPVLGEEFIRDPNVVLTRLGLHPRTSREIHDRVNRIFYAVLTNTELMELLSSHFSSLAAQEENAAVLEANEEVLEAALRRGEIENTLEVDMLAVDHMFSDTDVLRRVFELTLKDLNNRRLLLGSYSAEAIEDYVHRLVDAIGERRAIRDLPELESWDEQYGVGKRFGAIPVEVAPPVTAVIPVEGLAFITVVLPVLAYINGHLKEAAERSVLADPGAARRLAITGSLLRLAGEVMVHANNFERR